MYSMQFYGYRTILLGIVCYELLNTCKKEGLAIGLEMSIITFMITRRSGIGMLVNT
jgi:hypothetical protein